MRGHPPAMESPEARWNALRTALQSRYQSAAEAFVAFGGRAGFLLASSDIQKALRELSNKARQEQLPAIDVHALMSDVERSYEGGLTFTQFVDRIAWHQAKEPGREGAARPPAPGGLLQNRHGEGVATGGAQRFMVGSPASALRGIGSRPGTGTPRGAAHVRAAPVYQADASKLNQVRRDLRRSGGSVSVEEEGEVQEAPSGPGGGRWKGTAAPRHWMMKQRQLSAVQGGDSTALRVANRAPSLEAARTASLEAARTVGAVRAAGKRHMLEDAQKRLHSMLERQPPPPTGDSPPPPKEPPPPVRHPELIKPVVLKDDLDRPRHPAPPAPPADAQERGWREAPEAAEGYSSRLRALDGVVMDQRLSLAETEKNVLRRERAALEAQLRAQALEQRQAQVEMQQQMQQQMQALCQAMEKVGNGLLNSQQGSRQDPSQGGLSKRSLAELEALLDERIERELLPLAVAKSATPRFCHERYAVVLCVGNGEADSGAGEELAEKMEELEMIQDGEGQDIWLITRLLAPADPHTANSPALKALLAGGVYAPVCSWVHSDGGGAGPEGGTVGELAKLDPLTGEDWVDDFLLEILMALGVREATMHPPIIIPIWLALSGNNTALLHPFPKRMITTLSSKPSIKTNALAARLLASAGLPVSTQLLRLSVREAVARLAECAGVWLGGAEGGGSQSKGAGMRAASESVARMVSARAKIPPAREARMLASAHLAMVPTGTGDEDDGEDEGAPSEASSHMGDVSVDAGDELALERERERREKEKDEAMRREQDMLLRARAAGEAKETAEAATREAMSAYVAALIGMQFDTAEAGRLARKALSEQGLHVSHEVKVAEASVMPTVAEKTKQPSDGKSLKARRMAEYKARKFLAQIMMRWISWSEHFRSVRAKCLGGWMNRLRQWVLMEWARRTARSNKVTKHCTKVMRRERGVLLRWVWDLWVHEESLQEDGEGQQEGQESDEGGGSGAHVMEDVLQRLQAAVMETHGTHSRLLEMTQREEQLRKLLDRTPPEVSRAITNAGVASVPQLLKIYTDKGDKGLESLGIEQAPHRTALASLLEDPALLEAPQGGSEGDLDRITAGAKGKMAADMAALRAKLELKQKILAEGMEGASRDGENAQEAANPDDASLNLLNQLVAHLGGIPGVAAPVPVRPEGEVKEKKGEGEEDVEETEGDRETKRYMDRLQAEGGAQQAVLQLLASALGEDEKQETPEEERADAEEGKKERSLLVEQQKAMEAALKQVAAVMAKAHKLLDQPEIAAGDEQKAKEDREAAEALADMKTSAEEEAIRLADEAARRTEHNEALERENSRLKKQMTSVHAAMHAPGSPMAEERRRAPKRVDDADADSGEWYTSLADPELIARYASGGTGWEDDGEDGKSKLRLSWSLQSVGGGMPVSRAECLDDELSSRVAKAREGILKRITACKLRIEECKIEREKRLKDLEEGKTPEISKLRHDEAARKEEVTGIEIQILEEQLEGLDWQKELALLQEEGKRTEADAHASLEEAKRAHSSEPTEATQAELKDCEDRLLRVRAASEMRIRQREKEVEMAVLALRMHEDEEMIKKEQEKLRKKAQEEALEEQKKLAEQLRMMAETVESTARGRCRSEVLAKLGGVNKLKAAVAKHRLAVIGQQEAQRRREQEEIDREEARVRQDKHRKELDVQAKAERRTDEMTHRQRLLEEAQAALLDRKRKLLEGANEAMRKADAAVKAGGPDAELHSMWFKPEQKGEEQEYHASVDLAFAQGMVKELSGGVGEEGIEDAEVLEGLKAARERLSELEEIVGSAESKLKEEGTEALKGLEAMLKKDAKNMSKQLASELSDVRVKSEAALEKLKRAGQKSKELSTLETRLRTTWERGSSAIKAALRAQLSRGDAELDAAMVALQKGVLPAANTQLQRAKAAYEHAKLAQAVGSEAAAQGA